MRVYFEHMMSIGQKEYWSERVLERIDRIRKINCHGMVGCVMLRPSSKALISEIWFSLFTSVTADCSLQIHGAAAVREGLVEQAP